MPGGANRRRLLDIAADAFAGGWRFQSLAVADDHTRDCLAPVADGIAARRGRPATIVSADERDLTSAAVPA